MDLLMETLFKYKWSVFTRGELGFGHLPAGWSGWWVVIMAGLVAAGVAVVAYRISIGRQSIGRQHRSGERGDGRQWGMAALRGSLLLVLLLMLLRPVLVVPTVIPGSMSLALLIDDSRSMQLGDGEGGRTRIEAVREALGEPAPILGGLEARFRLRRYRFAGETAALPRGEWVQALKAEGTATDLAGALAETARDMAGSDLAGIVLVSDGGANTTRAGDSNGGSVGGIDATLRELRAAGIPVYTIGVGSADSFRDLELSRVSLPRRVLIGSAITADLFVRRTGGIDAGELSVRITEDGRPLKTERLDGGRLPSSGEAQPLTVDFSPSQAGAHRYGFELVTSGSGETNTENNLVEALVEVTNERPRILHLEGEPRWEYGKLRFSLARNEKNVTLVSVLRSADGKFYRQGVGSGSELTAGFPATAEELFGYDGLVLGSIEANFFSYEQLRLIEQFAGRRGGGVLALGGSRAFGAGKYAGTPVAELLPVVIGAPVPTEGARVETASHRPRLRDPERIHPVTRLNEDRGLSRRAWEEMPAVTIPERLTQIKPGAAVILEAITAGAKDEEGSPRSQPIPLLIEQRYGRGRSLALLANDTWRWRMELPSQNIAHETFWRQLLRYLVSTTPRRFEVMTPLDSYVPGDEVRVVAEVNDALFESVSDATVLATITEPDGGKVELPLEVRVEDRASRYVGVFRARLPGAHEIRMVSRGGDGMTGEATSSFLVSERSREFFEAAPNVPLLKRIATETGGRYFALEDAAGLVDTVSLVEGRHSERVRRDLWDMPINFLLLIGLVGAEWFLRKRQGLA